MAAMPELPLMLQGMTLRGIRAGAAQLAAPGLPAMDSECPTARRCMPSPEGS